MLYLVFTWHDCVKWFAAFYDFFLSLYDVFATGDTLTIEPLMLDFASQSGCPDVFCQFFYIFHRIFWTVMLPLLSNIDYTKKVTGKGELAQNFFSDISRRLIMLTFLGATATDFHLILDSLVIWSKNHNFWKGCYLVESSRTEDTGLKLCVVNQWPHFYLGK